MTTREFRAAAKTRRNGLLPRAVAGFIIGTALLALNANDLF